MSRVCSISIDIDTLRFYHQIHGLSSPDLGSSDPVYTHAMPRFLELFSRLGVRATLFVIGEDLAHPEHAEILRRAVEEGHELANHTQRHPYRLTRMGEGELEREIVEGEESIEALLPEGRRVVGFRCPGYNIDAKVLRILRARGYRYDSSIFPCPPYYLAKAAMIGWLGLRGRPSRSMLGSPRVMWSPMDPYQPSEDPHRVGVGGKGCAGVGPYERMPGNESLWEVPMSLMPGIRFPFIGTSILMTPGALLGLSTRLLVRRHALLNVELHAIDFLDPEVDPGLEGLVSHQPDLGVPLHEKHHRFERTFSTISRTHAFLPLAEATALL